MKSKMETNEKLRDLLKQVAEIMPTMLFIGTTADKQGALLMGSPEKTDEQRKIDLTATIAIMMEQNQELREVIFSAVSWFMQENQKYRDRMRLALKKMEELDGHKRIAEPE